MEGAKIVLPHTGVLILKVHPDLKLQRGLPKANKQNQTVELFHLQLASIFLETVFDVIGYIPHHGLGFSWLLFPPSGLTQKTGKRNYLEDLWYSVCMGIKGKSIQKG